MPPMTHTDSAKLVTHQPIHAEGNKSRIAHRACTSTTQKSCHITPVSGFEHPPGTRRCSCLITKVSPCKNTFHFLHTRYCHHTTKRGIFGYGSTSGIITKPAFTPLRSERTTRGDNHNYDTDRTERSTPNIRAIGQSQPVVTPVYRQTWCKLAEY